MYAVPVRLMKSLLLVLATASRTVPELKPSASRTPVTHRRRAGRGRGRRTTEIKVLAWRMATLVAAKLLKADGYTVVLTKRIRAQTYLVTNKRRAEIANGSQRLLGVPAFGFTVTPLAGVGIRPSTIRVARTRARDGHRGPTQVCSRAPTKPPVARASTPKSPEQSSGANCTTAA